MSEHNPLLDFNGLPKFDQIRPEHVVPAIDYLLAQGRECVEKLATSNEAPTWQNFANPLEDMEEKLGRAWSQVGHMNAVVNSPELREAYNAIQPKVSEFYSSIPLNEGLWKAIQRYAASADGRSLTGTMLRFQTKTIDSFKRHGAELDAPGKARLKELDVALAEVTTKFSENVLDATNAWELVVTEGAVRLQDGVTARRLDGNETP